MMAKTRSSSVGLALLVVVPQASCYLVDNPRLVGESASETTAEGSTTTTATTATTATEPPAESSSGPWPSCGNGIVETGEECDMEDLAGGTCEALGLDGGTLACGRTCVYDPSHCLDLPSASTPTLDLAPIKRFDFAWSAATGADDYHVLERLSPGGPFVQVGPDVLGESLSLEMPLHLRSTASYVLRACNLAGCTESTPVDAMGADERAIGYVKASSIAISDSFGTSVALSADGNTLAVGSVGDDVGAMDAGAVHLFVHDGLGAWSPQGVVRAPVPVSDQAFGTSVALGPDGSTLVVGATGGPGASGTVYVLTADGAGGWPLQASFGAVEPTLGDSFGISVALGSDGDTLAVGAEGDAATVGSAHVLVRNEKGSWSPQAYLQAPKPQVGERFGVSVALGSNGDTLAVGTGGGEAVYVFRRDVDGEWSPPDSLQAEVPNPGDGFGTSVALSADGNTLAVGAEGADTSVPSSGAVHVLTYDGIGAWSQQAFLEASNAAMGDSFGHHVALGGSGDTLIVGAGFESSLATGIDGIPQGDPAFGAGAAYAFVRDGRGVWSQRAIIKAPNTDEYDFFGTSVALSADGNTLAVGAPAEASMATGIGGDQEDDSVFGAGAVYLY